MSRRDSDSSLLGGQPYGAQRAARLPPKEHEDLVARMGGETTQGVHWDPNYPNDLVFPQMTREEARRILAARAQAGRDGPPQNPNPLAVPVRSRR